MGASASRPECMCRHAIAAGGERAVVGHEHERRTVLAVAAKQKLDDLAPGGLVEIAGRLVGDQDGRIGCERARERHALLPPPESSAG